MVRLWRGCHSAAHNRLILINFLCILLSQYEVFPLDSNQFFRWLWYFLANFNASKQEMLISFFLPLYQLTEQSLLSPTTNLPDFFPFSYDYSTLYFFNNNFFFMRQKLSLSIKSCRVSIKSRKFQQPKKK